MAPIYSQKRFFNMASVRHLDFEKFRFFVKFTWSEWKFVSVYQIWSKSDNSRLRYGNKAIFEMAAVRILNVRKLHFWSRGLYRHVILHFCSKFRVDRPIWRRDIAKKRFSIWCQSAILNLQNFDFLLNVQCPSWELKSTSAYQILSKSVSSRLRIWI